MTKPSQTPEASSRVKTVEEVASSAVSAVGWTDTESAIKHAISVITQDRQDIHSSLVEAVEADKRTMGTEINISNEYKLGYRQALSDTLTIINSIFKE